MSGTKDIEARLDRSLRNQVSAPKLDQDFNAAVWVRIAREEALAPVRAAAPSRTLRASRWLALSNVLGVAATLGVASYFAFGALGGIDVPDFGFDIGVRLPELSDETIARTSAMFGQALGVVAVCFGLSFTSLGRRLRRSFT